MPFTDEDRNMLATIHADVKILKGNDADKEVRLRTVEKKQWHFMGFVAALGTAVSAAWEVLHK